MWTGIGELWRRRKSQQRTMLASLYLLHCLDLVLFGYLAPFLPETASTRGIQLILVGSLFSAYSFAALIGGLLASKLLRCMSPKIVVVVTMILLSVSTAAFGAISVVLENDTFIIAAHVLRGFQGLFARLGEAAAFLLVASQQQREGDLSRISAILEGSAALGLVLGPPFGGVFYAWGGFGVPAYICAGMSLGLTILFQWSLPSLPRTSINLYQEAWAPFMGARKHTLLQSRSATRNRSTSGSQYRRISLPITHHRPTETNHLVNSSNSISHQGSTHVVDADTLHENLLFGTSIPENTQNSIAISQRTPSNHSRSSSYNVRSALSDQKSHELISSTRIDDSSISLNNIHSSSSLPTSGIFSTISDGTSPTSTRRNKSHGRSRKNKHKLKSTRPIPSIPMTLHDVATDGIMVTTSAVLRHPVVWIVLISAGFSIGALASTQPILAPHLSKFGVHSALIGLLFGLSSAAFMLSALATAAVLDNHVRFVRFALIASGLAILALSWGLTSPTEIPALQYLRFTLGLQIVALLLLGAGAGLIIPIALPLAAQHTRQLGRGALEVVARLMSVSVTLGLTLGPLASALLAQLFNFEQTCAYICYTLASLSAITFIIVLVDGCLYKKSATNMRSRRQYKNCGCLVGRCFSCRCYCCARTTDSTTQSILHNSGSASVRGDQTDMPHNLIEPTDSEDVDRIEAVEV